MSSSATAYAWPNARVRAMISQLLRGEQKRALVTAPRLEDALRLLEATPYAQDLAPEAREGQPLLTVEEGLQRNLVRAYEHVLGALAGAPRALLTEMLLRLEVDNLKAILRGVTGGSSPEEIRVLLVPLGPYSSLPIEALLRANNVAAVIDALGDLHYARVLRDALVAYRRDRSLFVLEVALDLDYYRRLWSAVEALPPSDREEAERLMGTRYDAINIDWVVRYRAVYGLSEVEIFNYTLSQGYRIDDDVIRRAAGAPDLAGLVMALPEPYRGLLQPLVKDGDLWRLEVALNRYLWREARRTLGGYPFRIGVFLGYLWLKEAEVHDLDSILEGKRYERSPDDIEAFLWGEA